MKLFVAMLGTETNTFSPIPCGENLWKSTIYHCRGDADADAPPVIQGLKAILTEVVEQRGWDLDFGICTFAQPASLTPCAVYEELRDQLLADIKASGQVDAVLLIMHGAMMAEGYDDCEGDVLEKVRDLVGAEVPIGAELDLHCHLTDKMLENATALIGYKEFPHVDSLDRLLELYPILMDAAEGKIVPEMSIFRCHIAGLMHTTKEPMRSFVDGLVAEETHEKVLNAWLGHGFPYGDHPESGAVMVVVTDGDRNLGDEIAERLGRKLFEIRKEVVHVSETMAECLDQAEKAKEYPITIADTGDNAGGGAASDSTFFIKEMMERGLENVAVAPLWDPVAVTICQDAGLNSRLKLRIGGKLGRASGSPVDVEATVVGLVDNVQGDMGGIKVEYGNCAAIKIHLAGKDSLLPEDGLDVVLTQHRMQGLTPNIFSDLGIDPLQKRILVVKSTQHFHAGFAPISKQVLYAGDVGLLPGNPLNISYEKADTSKLWPFVEDPFRDD